jgi:hypothetical protein
MVRSEIRTHPDRISQYIYERQGTILGVNMLGEQHHSLEESFMSGANDFDFLQGTWSGRNRRRTNPFSPKQDGMWEEFIAGHTGTKVLDEKVIIEQYEGTFPNGEIRKGLTIRTFDQQTQLWSIVWLDNRSPADFRPLVGKFQDGIGLFYQVIEAPDGQPLHVRFTWDEITADTAHWQQAFSFDGGKNWETNWVMALTKETGVR